MILNEHNAEQSRRPAPFEIALEAVCLFARTQKPYTMYQDRDVKTTLFLQYNHVRPQFKIHMRLLSDLRNGEMDKELEALHISTREQKSMDMNNNKEVSVLCTKGTSITMYNRRAHDQHAEISSQRNYLDKLPEATKEIMSHMTRPVMLKFTGGKHEMLTINLALNCPTWAEQVRNMVFADSCMVVLVDAGYRMEHFKTLKHYMENGTDPMSNFFVSDPQDANSFDTSTFIANPMPRGRLGFQASSVSKNINEQKVVRIAAIDLDHEPEARKIKEFEKSLKTLILASYDDEEYTEVYEGLITKPNGNECRLQTNQSFEIQFRSGKWDPKSTSWNATVMDAGSFEKNNMLSVLIYRGRDPNSKELSKEKPHAIKAKDLSNTELQDKVRTNRGNTVRTKLADNDSTYERVRAAYVSGPSCFRIREILLGLRLDLLDSVDLYRHIQEDLSELQKHMRPLNPRQLEVLEAARHILGGMLIFQGPPGTGKTYTLIQLMVPFFVAGKKMLVLAASPTNSGANDLVEGVCGLLSELPETGARKPYVLRAYPGKTEDEITRTQGSKQKTKQPSNGPASSSIPVTRMSEILKQQLAADKPKFEGVRDKRVSKIAYTIGYMNLMISGVVFNKEYTDPQKSRFESFRKLHAKQMAGKRLTVEEEKVWERESDKLTALAVQGASAIVSTTATISNPAVLKHAQDRVAAVFLDESAHEREDSLMPLFSTQFPLEPCFVLAGDQQQLTPFTRPDDKENDFKPQLAMSLMARMINLGMDYTMLTEQHRMVDQIAVVANTLTYGGHLTNDPSTKLCERPLARKFQQYVKNHYDIPTNLLLIDLPHSKTNVVTRDDKRSKTNDFSICVIAEIVPSLLNEFGAEATLAVLTPYKGQFLKYELMIGKMRELGLENLDKVTISTVDSAQGQQYDIVIFDLTCGSSAGFLESENRLNVAMTRARNGLIVVCDTDTIESAFYKKPVPTPYMKRLLPFFKGLIWRRERDDNFPATQFYTPAAKVN